MADKFIVTVELPQTGCTREDIYDAIRTALPTAELADLKTIDLADGKFYAKSAVARWRKFSFTHNDFTAAGLTESITLFANTAGGVIHKTVIHVTEAWEISGMTELDLSVGIAGDTDEYSADSHAAGEETGATLFDAPGNGGLESMTENTTILLTAASNAGNLNTATAGAVDVYVFWSGLGVDLI